MLNETVESVPLTKNLSSFNIAMALINSKLASNKLPMVNPISLRGVTEGVIVTVFAQGAIRILVHLFVIFRISHGHAILADVTAKMTEEETTSRRKSLSSQLKHMRDLCNEGIVRLPFILTFHIFLCTLQHIIMHR